MSSTNKTTNYNLSQFIGSDKPAWLADYNSDMGKIDTGMKNNADAISVTDGKADTNATNIGTLSNLNTQTKTSLVGSINEVYNTAGTADGTAQAAATAANGAKTEADALTRYLSITQNGKINPTVSGGTIGNINDLYYALNADGTLGKIYGRFRYTVNSTGVTTVTLPVPAISTEEAFTISSMVFYTSSDQGGINILNSRDAVVNTNGNIVIEMPSGQSIGSSIYIWIPPCLYFFTDFGDVVNPNS